MAFITTDDGVTLYYEEAGSGTPIIFVHEFAGDHRSYEAQLRHFARDYRCIAFNARGFPPSDVPEDPTKYSQDRARDDILAILDGLGLDKAHVLGISMGGFAALHFGLQYPERALSLVVGGCGYGAEKDRNAGFRKETDIAARRMVDEGMAAFAEVYALGPTRVQFVAKDPRGWREFAGMLAEHSAKGSALTMGGVQKMRPSLYDLAGRLAAMTVPTLIVAGDEDEPCLDASIFMKRTIPSAALAIMPGTGHTLNLEEPDLFHYLCGDFFHRVERGRWTMRDPRSVTSTIIGMR